MLLHVLFIHVLLILNAVVCYYQDQLKLWLGDTDVQYVLEQLISLFCHSRDCMGGRRRGRQRKQLEDNIRDWTGLELSDAVRRAEEWRMLVARSCGASPSPSPHSALEDCLGKPRSSCDMPIPLHFAYDQGAQQSDLWAEVYVLVVPDDLELCECCYGLGSPGAYFRNGSFVSDYGSLIFEALNGFQLLAINPDVTSNAIGVDGHQFGLLNTDSDS